MVPRNGLVWDEPTGLWLLPSNPRRPRELRLDVEMGQALFSTLLAGRRRKVGAFRYAAMVDVYDADAFAPNELDAVVLPVSVLDGEEHLVVAGPKGQRLGWVWWPHGHLVAAFAELEAGQLGIRAWLRSPDGWFNDIMVSLAEPEAVHAAIATFASARGSRLLAPARASRYGDSLAPPYIASKQVPAPAFTNVRRFEEFDASDLVAMTAPGGPDVLPPAELSHPMLGEVIERDGELTEYLPLSEVDWDATTSRVGITSALETGWEVYVARHRRTGAWAAITVDLTGASGAVDAHLHQADNVRWLRRGWGIGKDVIATFEAGGTTWFFGVEHVHEVDADGGGWTWSAHSFGTSPGGQRKGARYAELVRSRARAIRASASYRRRAAEFGFEASGVVIFDPWTIYERDGWRCGVCGGSVDRTVQWPAEGCATLDHRRPIARGGEHTPGNTQLAHWRCNLAKGDRATTSR
ncbi:HNH endonuclease [Isoptericola sp. S6320L]|uniref:HNH endonuclease n=1 Tax=Isoptericola sp. S6320L TaxID=2926411 RepID=UPI001FF360BF|nr:HNH endonuclease signature motif containing protein [Isoptericola sp. S6320L]MCK0115988.1 HNH endonuclease [Isoptericola sp. S6320L]